MSMKKIAIINQRYGKEVIGGSESYTMLLANHLKKEYEVEILTSKALTYDSWADYYEGDERIDDILVRRFSVRHPRRRFLSRGLLYAIIRLHLNFCFLGKLWLKYQGPYVPELVTFLKEHKEDYDFFIFVTYLYYPTARGMQEVMEKAFFIPTAHEEPMINMKIYRDLFQKCRGLLYLTPEEKALAEEKFHNETIPNEVIGVGIEVPEDISGEAFRLKYGIEGDYLLYVGRVDSMKGCKEMFAFYETMREKFSGLQLVVMGKSYMEIPKTEGIRYLGIVDEADKYAGMKEANALWLPSANESLSLVVLESMAVGTPVIVNGACKVLEGHCIRSNAGIAYKNEEELQKAVRIFFDKEVSMEYGKRGMEYVRETYTWQQVTEKVKKLLK